MSTTSSEATHEAPSTPAPPAPARRLFPTILRSGAWGVIVIFVAECLRIFISSNYFTVVPGMCYRSAQPSPHSLENAQRFYHIRSVFNLRDENEHLEWYRQERMACERLGLKLVNAGLSSKEQPPAHDFQRFVLSMRDCPEPMLIHCANGNDRTGLASAVYLLLRTPTPLPEARKQLSLRYGHIKWTKASCLMRILDGYECWLTQSGQEHSADRLCWWAVHVFQPEDLTPAKE